MRVGVVGGGFMGVWLRRELSTRHQVLIYDVDPARTSWKPENLYITLSHNAKRQETAYAAA
ncbi:MAG: hypothetical protein ACO2PN_09340 [Pyrobaculum sp.]|jgi:prephenate dehydrogenase